MSLLAACAAAAPAVATPLDPKVVPATAKWVLHIDADVLRESELGALLLANMPPDTRGEIERGLDQLNEFAGVRLDVDTKAVTLFGTGFGDDNAVVILDAPVGENALLPLLKMNAGFKQFTHGDHSVVSWKDEKDNKTRYGSFYSPGRVVIGNGQAAVEAALDVLDGGKSMADNEDFKPAAGPGVMAVMYVDGVDELVKKQQPQSPLVGLVNRAAFAVSETKGTVRVDGTVEASSAESATQLKTIAEGGRALLLLAARSGRHRTDPRAKTAAAGLASAKVTADKDVVKLEWPVTINVLSDFADAVAAGKAAERPKAD